MDALAKYGGMDASLTARLKKMYAEALTKKWWRHLNGERWRSGPWRSG